MVSTDISVYAPEDEEINLESLTNLLAKRNYIPHEGLKLNGNFIVRKVNTNDDLILKLINVKKCSKQLNDIINEANQLKKLENPYFIKHYDFFHDGPWCFFVTEGFDGKSFKQLLDGCIVSNNDMLIGSKSFVWIKQLLKALEFLHTSRPEKIIHGNLNPNTIFLNKNAIKIGEFRSTIDCTIPSKLEIDIYKAPELIQGKFYDEKIDIWSFGAIAVDMLSLKMSEISISKKLPVEYISVINSSMRQNPIERSTAIDLLKILDSEHFKQRTTFIRSKETNITKSIKIIDSNKAICEIVQKENKFNSKLYFTKNKKLYRSVSEIVSCTDDNEIRLWDITHEVCIATLDAHKNYIWCLEYLEITGEIISGSSDNKIKVWNVNTGDCTRILDEHYNSVLCLKLLSGKLISGSADSNLKIWNLETWECIKTLRGHTKSVLCLEKLNSNEFITGSLDRTIKIWNFCTGKCLKTLKNSNCICCLKVLAPKNELISGSFREIKIYNTVDWSVVNTFPTLHNSFIRSIDMLPTGEMISCAENDSIRIWDKTKGYCIKKLISQSKSVFCLEILENGDLICGSSDKTLKIWNLNRGECFKIIEGGNYSIFSLKSIK